MLGEFLILCAATVGGTDWPQFRGPDSDGHATGPPTPMQWSDTTHVAWKVGIPGLGWSSPVVAGGKVFLTTAVPRREGLSLRVMALDVASGDVVWDRQVRALDTVPPIHAKNSHASPTPLVRDGAVFVHFGAQGIARVAAADGALQWVCLDLEYPPMHGSGGSPVLHNGKLVVVCDGSRDPFVAAVDAASGRVVWQTPRQVQARLTHSFVTPTVALVDGQAQVMAPGPDHFAAYDLDTGRELWRVLAPGWSVVPQPALGHGLVFYNRDYDRPELMAVRLGGQGDVTRSHIAWRIARGAPSTPSPLLVGDELYFVSDGGIASCVDARTGQPHWMERLGGNYSASPIFANGCVLFLNETGRATWIRASREFAVVGQNELPARTLATPAFADGAMFLRTDEHLYKFSERRPVAVEVETSSRSE
jgi:outer membrane protein assembly factor BamB